jgi:4-hydroxy-3-polyprenylbenzoate decarboxylase
LPGVLAITGPRWVGNRGTLDTQVAAFCQSYTAADAINPCPLIVVVDDSDLTARTLNNLLWVTFTRSDPAPDVYGIEAFTVQKHWGCRGALVIDARIKPHHAPPLIVDPEITKRVDALAARGGPLARYL